MYYGPLMHGYEWGWGALSMVLWLLFFCCIALLVLRLLRNSDGGSAVRKQDPIDIAKERYAKGEITKTEFEQLKKDLI